jgi:hypothetical protein
MAKKPEPPKPISWSVHKMAAKAVRLGTVEAADEAPLSRRRSSIAKQLAALRFVTA